MDDHATNDSAAGVVSMSAVGGDKIELMSIEKYNIKSDSWKSFHQFDAESEITDSVAIKM